MIIESNIPATYREARLIADGQVFKQLIKAALAWLQRHQVAINALNVYPVPDGDTGTNMVLTMQSAWAEIQDSPERNVGRIARQMAHGALMGARGNSGVILSQIWRGFARSLDEKEVYRAKDLAAACQEGVATAYRGVVKPVEGTILTVARAVADEAARVAGETEDLVYILERMVLAAREAVKMTPTLLPVLAQAGVVDAGGQGLAIILEGMLRYMHGEPVTQDLELTGAVDLVTTGLAPGEAGYGYDVQFLIAGQGLDVDAIRERIAAMGECPLVVGEPTLVKVHVHVLDPGIPISYGASLGSLREVVVEDMQAQYRDFIAGREGPAVVQPPPSPPREPGIVAVVMGDGLAHVFQSLGAGAIVYGGQTMNPSTQELLEAIESLPSRQVIVLPNNGNVILAAQQASALSSKRVAVVPSRSIPQGIAALLALNAQADLDMNVAVMSEAIKQVRTGEITTATRSVTINGVTVSSGELIGLCDDELKVSGASVEEVARKLLREMDASQKEIITLYYGEGVSDEEARALAELIAQEWPDQEVEVVAGGQPHYPYILSVE